MSCDIGANCSCGFKNTGMKYPEVWTGFHKDIDVKIGCEECNVHGHEIVYFDEDLVRAGIGKQVKDKKNFHRIADQVACVRAKCQADGRC